MIQSPYRYFCTHFCEQWSTPLSIERYNRPFFVRSERLGMTAVDKLSLSISPVKAVSCYTTKVDFKKIAKVPGVDCCELPGSDDLVRPYPNCGEVRFKTRCSNPECPNHTDYQTVKNWCHSKECPVCYRAWARRQAKKATERVWWAFTHEPAWWSRNPKNIRHVVLNVPPDLWHKPYPEVLTWGLRKLKQIGARGGCYIGHPWRFRDLEGGYIQWKHSDLNKHAEAPVIESVAVYAPHLHFIVWGWLIPSDEAHERYGFTYKTLGARPNEESIFGTIYYQLTHAGIYPHSHTLRWFGSAGYNRIQVTEWRELQPVSCILCDAPLEYEYEGMWQPYSVLVTRRHFKFKILAQSKLIN